MAERFFRSIRLLAQCYQTFEQLSNADVRRTKLTSSQFDIVATLGNTEGMTFRELGERTLITKGTLTGVIDRLEARGLVRRVAQTDDRRCTLVQLTTVGQQEFERIFPSHVQHCRQPFLDYKEEDFAALERELGRLKAALDVAIASSKD
ncbi:MarR family transcriptional regulator [Janthinobacterium sp. 17J80-10]|uniref:MarR family winged helix-turn-helix transcriptional regulator n=1 Tax=Janthinobacterium sp. 17J80-10 TaxID=2497863 RepID=UPI0010052CC6|nr:MarR family transcriptional regulator [Janthinobacterium sp. 17J80-10]QAU35676.1 MarR family transcriptional regulator [Janthinobacterium sp. 17J80-10]